MSTEAIAMVAVLFFFAALIYSSVGHAGASAYLATMALVGAPPAIMRPTAFVLNIVVASLVAYRFIRGGFFSWPTFWPFAIASVPAAFLAAQIPVPVAVYKRIVGVVLFYAAWRLFAVSKLNVDVPAKPPGKAIAIPVGAGIGVLSGTTGTGGGIFLSPVLLLSRWATTRETSGISAAFILVNSIAGLAGSIAATRAIPKAIFIWLPCVLAGSLLGSQLGLQRLNVSALQKMLGVVLVIAGFKLLLT